MTPVTFSPHNNHDGITDNIINTETSNIMLFTTSLSMDAKVDLDACQLHNQSVSVYIINASQTHSLLTSSIVFTIK
jgi:hypothetical protein